MAPRPLRIVKSCGEPWDAMTPRGAGRHCASCDRVVLDLAGMTLKAARAEVDRARRETGSACGRAEGDPETGALVFAPPAEAPRPLRRAARGALLAAALVAGCDREGGADAPAAATAQLVPLPPTAPPTALDSGATPPALPPPPPLIPCAVAAGPDADAGRVRHASHRKRPAAPQTSTYYSGFME